MNPSSTSQEWYDSEDYTVIYKTLQGEQPFYKQNSLPEDTNFILDRYDTEHQDNLRTQVSIPGINIRKLIELEKQRPLSQIISHSLSLSPSALHHDYTQVSISIFLYKVCNFYFFFYDIFYLSILYHSSIIIV